MPAGRPSKYKPEHAEIASALCKAGATDPEIAENLKISISTLSQWKIVHPEFMEALTRGKKVADKRVVESLYKRATGYTYDAVKIFMPAGAKAPIYAPFVEHVPPDPTSMIFWLKNRDRENWRDKHDHEHTGKDGAPLIPAVNVTIGRAKPESPSETG